MKPTSQITRRNFVATTALAAAATVAVPTLARAEATQRFKVIVFSKAFAQYSPDETADLLVDVGWDGIECPVRTKAGQIAPEKVEEDLPKMVEALKKRGKEVTIVTTEITQIDPLAEKVLRTAAKLGIKKYRLGFTKYTADKPIPQTVHEVGAALKDLAALNKELGLQGAWQNHSGADMVGAPLWDLWTMIKDLDPQHLGVCFDIGHATLEGGLSWPIQARLMQPYYAAVFLKDFYWQKGAKGWEPLWCNFGEGEVHREFLTRLKASTYDGPLCQHFEYKTLGTGPEMIANMKKDFAKLKEWLA
jgi:sugar phosphate isomerase/epimerase